jgi:hypothetical protein
VLSPGETGHYSDYYVTYARIEECHSTPVDYRVTPTYPHKTEIEFVDTPPITLHIANTLPVPVTISDIKYMYPDSIIVPANGTNSGTIYTKEPIFTVSADGYLVSYKYTYDASGSVLYVTVE